MHPDGESRWLRLAADIDLAKRELAGDERPLTVVRNSLARLLSLDGTLHDYERVRIPDAVTALERIGAHRDAQHLERLATG